MRGLRAASIWLLTWLACAAFWLLLVDTRYAPEWIAGAVAAAVAATASELVRHQRIARLSVRPRWLRRAWRPLARVPLDIGLVVGAIAAQVVRPRAQRGRLRALRFDPGGDDPRDHGRHALAEALGSLAPNTYVIGIDERRKAILVHQLVDTRDPAAAIDPLELR